MAIISEEETQRNVAQAKGNEGDSMKAVTGKYDKEEKKLSQQMASVNKGIS